MAGLEKAEGSARVEEDLETRVVEAEELGVL